MDNNVWAAITILVQGKSLGPMRRHACSPRLYNTRSHVGHGDGSSLHTIRPAKLLLPPSVHVTFFLPTEMIHVLASFPPSHTHTIFCRFAFHSAESLSPSVAIIISVVHPSFYTRESRWEGGKYRIYHFIVNCTPLSPPQMRIIIIITTIIIIIVIAIIYIGIIIILCEFRKRVVYRVARSPNKYPKFFWDCPLYCYAVDFDFISVYLSTVSLYVYIYRRCTSV